MKISKILNRLALASVIFSACVIVIFALVLLLVAQFKLSFNPLSLSFDLNHRKYNVSPSNSFSFLPTRTPLPTSTPLPVARINNIIGHPQLYTLDCEARSAVDLAAFFGTVIDEKEFLNRMPHSTNPNKGFVGNFTDLRGKIPPQSYGIYAAPVAKMLRDYGINATDQHAMTFDRIKDEISAGHPVMVWVTGNTETGWSTTYTTPDGEKIPVSPFEHTVIITGYDASYVDILDGDSRYQRIIADFLKSWGNMGNMAITVSPQS